MIRLIAALSVGSLLLSSPPAPQSERTTTLPEKLTSFAIGTGGPFTNAVAQPFDITIERWSSEDERLKLVRSLGQGQKAGVEVLSGLKSVGYVSSPGSIRWDLRYAHQEPTKDGGRRIFLATDRPISFEEAFFQTPSTDYPFTFIELTLNSKGEGSGTLARATRVTADTDGRFIVAENYESQPITLGNVKRR